MDTQRLILFLVFSFSLMFLWEAYQKHVNPPAPLPAKTASGTQRPAPPGAAAEAGRRAEHECAGRAGAGPARWRPARPPGTPAAASAPQGEQVTVRTDLFTATIDSVGGVISEVALSRHRDATDPKKPYKVIQRGDAVSIAQAGLLGEGLPNHRTQYRVLPGPRELAPGQDRFDVKLEATARQRRPGRADADVPPRQLRHRRRVRGEERDRPAADAVRVLPADARHQDRAAAELVDAGRVHRAGRLQRGRQVQEGRLRRDRQARRRRRSASRRSRPRPTTAGSG